MEQRTSKVVEDMIARISTSYLKEYRRDIVGVYLVPFTIGGHQKIEIVIVSCGELDIKVKPPKKVNELTILSSVTDIKEYVGIEKEKRYFELKAAYILYDPTKRLEKAKEMLLKDEEVSVYYNIYEVPEQIVKTVKSTLYKVREKNKKASRRI